MKPVLWMLLCVGLSGVLLVYVWGRVDVVRVGYELNGLSRQKAALEQERDRLRIQLSQLMAPDRIAKEANRKLNMTRPSPQQVILVPVRADNGMPRHGRARPLRVAQYMRD
ncbi:MAG: cell division protein FtsL [Nitrospira sp.]|nr:cell division protein FtsL [Nitrospira sp.]